MAEDNVVTTEGFPDGIRCARCNEIMEPGMRYAEIPDGFIGDTICVLLVCVPCSLGTA